MKLNKRQLLKTSLGSSLILSRWTAPTIMSVALPAHAQTSVCNNQTWEFTYTFNNVDCGDPSFCDGLTDQEIIGSANKPQNGENICLTEEEISSGQFNRDIDFDGQGPAADYVFVNYVVEISNGSQMSGTISCTNVDTFISISGTWTAERLIQS